MLCSQALFSGLSHHSLGLGVQLGTVSTGCPRPVPGRSISRPCVACHVQARSLPLAGRVAVRASAGSAQAFLCGCSAAVSAPTNFHPSSFLHLVIHATPDRRTNLPARIAHAQLLAHYHHQIALGPAPFLPSELCVLLLPPFVMLYVAWWSRPRMGKANSVLHGRHLRAAPCDGFCVQGHGTPSPHVLFLC